MNDSAVSIRRMPTTASILLLTTMNVPAYKKSVCEDHRLGHALTENHTPETILRIRIVAPPAPQQFDGFDVARYRVGQTYDLPVHLATILMISGCAESAGAVTSPAEAADFRGPVFPRRTSKP